MFGIFNIFRSTPQEFIIGKENIRRFNADPSCREEILNRQRSRGFGSKEGLNEFKQRQADIALIQAWWNPVEDLNDYSNAELREMAEVAKNDRKLARKEGQDVSGVDRALIAILGLAAGAYLADKVMGVDD